MRAPSLAGTPIKWGQQLPGACPLQPPGRRSPRRVSLTDLGLERVSGSKVTQMSGQNCPRPAPAHPGITCRGAGPRLGRAPTPRSPHWEVSEGAGTAAGGRGEPPRGGPALPARGRTAARGLPRRSLEPRRPRAAGRKASRLQSPLRPRAPRTHWRGTQTGEPQTV